ncbi:MAG: hypothetical protein BalsKO_10200 [Balneolaceae bacterium]
MKNLFLSLFLVASFILINCESEPVTGSEEVLEIENVQFVVDSTYTFGNDFKAEGTITNIGNSSITPIWYLEASFFRDQNQTFKMGGDNTSYSFSLGSGQSTGWQITFRNNQYPASENPDFSVGEIRVYKNDTNSSN